MYGDHLNFQAMRRKALWKWAIGLTLACLVVLQYHGKLKLSQHHRRHHHSHHGVPVHGQRAHVQPQNQRDIREEGKHDIAVGQLKQQTPDSNLANQVLAARERFHHRSKRAKHHDRAPERHFDGDPSRKHHRTPNLKLNEPRDDSVFIPSFNWQIVKKGQSVPPGLEISIDMQTGEKKARLMKSRPGIMLPSEIKRASEQRLSLMQQLSEIGEHARVRCETTQGDVVIELRFDWAPLGAMRFAELILEGFMTNNVIYRVPPITSLALAQFGLVPSKSLDARFRNPIKDDPLRNEMKKGYIAFAGSGDNSRTSQMWVARTDTTGLGHSSWETPVARIVEGLDMLDRLYPIGDMNPWGNAPDTNRVYRDKTFYTDFPGAYLRTNFASVDYWKTCSFE
eukprot:m.132635 g.132635  ORF g.132635 m.132635 type:complete len:395 (+) comp29622_c0_seq1:105-1289(+)